MGRKETECEDLAIQDTLAMGVDERLKLLANLIVEKIDEDQLTGHNRLNNMQDVSNA